MGMPVRHCGLVITTIKALLTLAVLVTVAGCATAPRPPASGQRWTGLDDADTLNVAEQLLLRD
jgi:hypothetical protein